MKPLTAGRVARRLLAFYDNKPERWTRGWFAKTKNGGTTNPEASDAVCFCTLGALRLILELEEGCSQLHLDRYREAIEVLGAALGRGPSVFNDRCSNFQEFKTRLHEIARLP